MSDLAQVRAKRLILISSIDVYPIPRNVDEYSIIDPALAEPYGRNRYALEKFISATFPKSLVVRLPGLFGKHMRKNFVFDLIRNRQALPLTHEDSTFQYYEIARLWQDLETALKAGLSLLNITAEPVRAKDVAQQCADLDFLNQTDQPPVTYDVWTRHSGLLGGKGHYHFSAEVSLRKLRDFMQTEMRQS